MRKIIFIALCVVLAAVMLTGCVSISFSPYGASVGGNVSGRGNLETFTFNVSEINEIRVEMFCNIEFYSAPSDTVTFQVQPNLMDYITVEESGGVLTVRSSRNINFQGTANTPVLTVSTPSLSRVFHAGAGRFTTFDPITGDSFSLYIAGAANGNVELDVRNLNVTLAGAGDFDLSGAAENATIDVMGAGRLNALELDTRTASVSLAGAGTVRISCSESLNVSAAGVGTVEYRGSPSLDITRGGLVTVTRVD